MKPTSASSNPLDNQSYAAGPSSLGFLFSKRRAYSCVATEPRLKNAECVGPVSSSEVISTVTLEPDLRAAGSPYLVTMSYVYARPGLAL